MLTATVVPRQGDTLLPVLVEADRLWGRPTLANPSSGPDASSGCCQVNNPSVCGPVFRLCEEASHEFQPAAIASKASVAPP